MKIDEKLKEYIKSRYKSLRNFALNSDVGLPYTTIDGMLKRGIANTSIDNVLKICKTLGISADGLADGMIIPVEEAQEAKRTKDIAEMLYIAKTNLRTGTSLTLGGEPLTQEETNTLLDAIDIAIEIIRRRRYRA